MSKDWEIENLRADERYASLRAEICDSVLYEMMLEPHFDNATMSRYYRAAIEEFKDRMDPEEIRGIVDATVLAIQTQRRRAAVARKVVPEPRRGINHRVVFKRRHRNG